MKVNNKLFKQKLHENKFMILVHRGSHGGNIVENTSEAVRVSRLQHADVAEIDIAQSTDGKFYIFHDGRESRLLGIDKNIKKLSSEEIEQLFYFNSIGEEIAQKVEDFDYLYNHIDHQTFLNIDRSWFYWETFLPFLDKYPVMHEYFILKSPPERKYLQILNDHKIKYLYFPIIDDPDQLDVLTDYPYLNIVGLELVDQTKDLDLIKSDKLREYLDNDYMVLADSLKLNSRVDLFGGLDDNLALLDDPDKAWSKILKTGINAIQTDWPDVLNDYRKKVGGLDYI